MIRLLKVFAISSDYNLNKHPIQEKLVMEIEKKLHEMDENDVLQLLRTYQYLTPDIKGSTKLFHKLNDTVTELAIQNS